MMVRLIILFLALSALLRAERPNILFILTDDQRQDSLPIYGNSFVKTPHIDQFAAESVVFEHASVTSAICTPSRASYFSGQYERRHAINFNSGTAMSGSAWENCYPSQLRKAGYFTGYIGKNHLPVGPQGYQTGLMDGSFDFWYAGHGHIRFYPKNHHEIFAHAKAHTQLEIINEGTQNFLSGEEFLEGAQTFLKSRDSSKPFALSLCLNLPHGAGTSTMKMKPSDDELYRTAYRDRLDEIPLPKTYLAKAEIKTPKLPADLLHTQFRQRGYDYVDAPETLRERMVRQYQTITGIDRLIGNIRAKLEELGVAENTLIVYSSDHGLLLGDHGLGGKSLNYEPCLAVPLIIHDPRIRKGRREKALVQSIDIAPTLLDYAGAPIPSSMQGKSLKPLLEEKVIQIRQFAFAENLWSNYFGNPRIESLRGPRFKYIRYFKNGRERWSKATKKTLYKVTPAMAAHYASSLNASIMGEQPVYEELFDLEVDPLETTNLINEPSLAVTATLFRQQCQAHVTQARGDWRIPVSTLPIPADADAKAK
ncbi:MAG: sulfatase-like hydrolase/transferase [Akkermansiaceae bacterium]